MGGSLARTTLPAAVASATYDANNRLTHWGGTTLTYDDNGNLILEGSTSYTWNARNQMSATSLGAASYAYDAAGRRRSRTVSGVSLQTLYDGWNAVQLKQSGAAVENRLFGLGLDEIYGRTNSSTSQSYLTDALGSVLSLRNADQSAQADYTYGAYGETTETPPGASSNLIQYTGREQDTAGLYYYRNRYYSAVTSRFISPDPIGLAGGVNQYSYVNGNPVGSVDPDGLQASGIGRGLFGPSGGFGWSSRSKRGNFYDNPNAILNEGGGSSSSSSSQARCEKICDDDYDFDQKQCEAWWKTTGRDPGAYRLCMENARNNYIKCIQDCNCSK